MCNEGSTLRDVNLFKLNARSRFIELSYVLECRHDGRKVVEVCYWRENQSVDVKIIFSSESSFDVRCAGNNDQYQANHSTTQTF